MSAGIHNHRVQFNTWWGCCRCLNRKSSFLSFCSRESHISQWLFYFQRNNQTRKNLNELKWKIRENEIQHQWSSFVYCCRAANTLSHFSFVYLNINGILFYIFFFAVASDFWAATVVFLFFAWKQHGVYTVPFFIYCVCIYV